MSARLMLGIPVILSPFSPVAVGVSCDAVLDKNCTTTTNGKDQCPSTTAFLHIPYNTPCCCDCPEGTVSLGVNEATCHPRSHYITPEPQDGSDEPKLNNSTTWNMPMLSPATSGVLPTRPDEVSPLPDGAHEQERTEIPSTMTTSNVHTVVAVIVVIAVVILAIAAVRCWWKKRQKQDVEMQPMTLARADNAQRADDDNRDRQNGGIEDEATEFLTDIQIGDNQPANGNGTLD